MSKSEENTIYNQKLDVFFDAVKADPVMPSEGLYGAILEDAERLQPKVLAGLPAPQRGFLREALYALGGWPAMAGMTSAVVAGIWLGVVAPGGLETLSGGLIRSSGASLIDGSFTLEDMAPSHLTTSFLTTSFMDGE